MTASAESYTVFDPNASATGRTDRVTLEITTRCNLKCVMCPHGLPEGLPGQSDASDTLIGEVIRYFDKTRILQPTGVGEPLLSPGFWKIVDALAGRTNPMLMFVTNGILLTKPNVERLTQAPLFQVNVSLDAARPDTHLRIRGNDLEKSLAGVRNLTDMRARTGADFLIRFAFVIMRENVEEAPAFVEMAHSLGANAVYFEHMVTLVTDPKAWNVKRGNWLFNYAENELRGDPAASDPWILKAMDRADALGIRIDGSGILLAPGLEAQQDSRPCRLDPGARVSFEERTRRIGLSVSEAAKGMRDVA
jgi:molybdenum cofactor biosynthesis enzyme MoaA